MKKIFATFTFFLLAFVSSCTSFSKNYLKTEELRFKSSEKTDHQLTFKRASWFQNMILGADVLVHKINKSDWSNYKFPGTCETAYSIISYTNDERIFRPMISRELRKNGLKEFYLDEFKDFLEAHPELAYYKLLGFRFEFFCSKTNISEDLVMKFPHFDEASL